MFEKSRLDRLDTLVIAPSYGGIEEGSLRTIVVVVTAAFMQTTGALGQATTTVSAADANQRGATELSKKDFAEARRWWTIAAAQGNADAEYNIGFLYEHGLGVAQNYAQAMNWFQKAAAQGNADAAYNIAGLYEHGRGVAQDYAQAMTWYRKAAAQGHSHAEGNIAFLYEHGLGVAADLSQARSWYTRAGNDGLGEAKKWLAAHPE